MEVYKEFKIVLRQLDYCLLSSIYGRMVMLARVHIESIQILSLSVHSVVASRHAIWVQDRNDFKNESLPQQLGLFAFRVNDKVKGPIEDVRSRSFARMHPRGKEDNWLIVK